MNADGQIASIGGNILGYNQFAYCFNNSVNMSDPSGNWPKWNDVVNFGKKMVNSEKKAVVYYSDGTINNTPEDDDLGESTE